MHLREPFLKVEDNEGNYRPVYKEFLDWPQVYFDSDSCPFIKRKVQKLQNDTKTLEGLAYTQKLHSNFDNNKNVDKTKETPETAVKNMTSKKKIPQFCEICQQEYDNLIKVSILSLFIII